MQKGEWEGTDNQIYEYQLLEFVTRGPKGQRKVDIVPSSWPHYNAQKKGVNRDPIFTTSLYGRNISNAKKVH